MTGAGWEALGLAARVSLENTVHLYTETRELIRVSLTAVSERCVVDPSGHKRVVFYGAGDVAEIAYVSLQSTDLTLVGVVDDRRTGRFFDLNICGPEQFTVDAVGGVRYAHVIVTSVRHAESIRARLAARAIPSGQVSCLDSVVAGDAARQAANWPDLSLGEPASAPRRDPRG